MSKTKLTFAICLATTSLLADFTVTTDIVDVTQSIVGEEGGEGTITDTGSITSNTNGIDCVQMGGADNQILTNDGTLTTTQFTAEAINCIGGDNFQITNSGTITTTSISSLVLLSGECSGTLTNTGSITTERLVLFSGENTSLTLNNTGLIRGETNPFIPGFEFFVITCQGDLTLTNDGTIRDLAERSLIDQSTSGSLTLTNNGTMVGRILSNRDSPLVTNNGSISAGTFLGAAIDLRGSSATVNNNLGGTVTASGGSNPAIELRGAGSTCTNGGGISTTGSNAHGVELTGSSSAITNTGTITTTNTNANGILATANSATIVNSGTISTANTGSEGVGITAGTGSTLTNTGNITTTGATLSTVLLGGADNVLSNSGTISATGATAHGVTTSASGCQITNSAGGTISTGNDNANGINSTGTSVTVTNSGSITSTGDTLSTVLLDGDDATLTNNGTISSTGDTAHGVTSSQTGATITNNSSGTITTTNDNAIGINSTATSATITNNGSISTAGAAAHGISIAAANASVTNTSPNSIITTGDGAHGINSVANNATIINNGTGLISTSGIAAHGILSTGNNASITNCGTITVTGANSNGIRSTGDNAVVTNGGVITSAQSTAIVFTGLNPTLILEGGSVNGGISSTNPLNLTVETNGPNRIIIFGDGGFQNINVTDPFVVVGSSFAIVNPTGFVMQTAMLEDLTDGIFSALYTNRFDYLNCCCPEPSLWVQVIGSHRQESGTTPYYVDQGGLLLGLSTGSCSLFAGASFESGVVENPLISGTGVTCGTCGVCSVGSLSGDRLEESDASSYFGGFSFEKFYCVNNPLLDNLFLSAAATGGYVRWDNRRTVENNTAPSGVEIGHAPNTVWMFAAETTAATRFEECCTKVRPGLGISLRYAGYYMGDYDDHNTAARMEVFDRNVQIIKLRGEASLAFRKAPGKFLEPYLAVAGRFQLSGNRVTSTLLGVPLNFNLAADHNIGEKIAGIRGEWDMSRSRLFFNVEGMWDTENSSRALGEIGYKYNY